jgi:hypothetical protein
MGVLKKEGFKNPFAFLRRRYEFSRNDDTSNDIDDTSYNTDDTSNQIGDSRNELGATDIFGYELRRRDSHLEELRLSMLQRENEEHSETRDRQLARRLKPKEPVFKYDPLLSSGDIRLMRLNPVQWLDSLNLTSLLLALTQMSYQNTPHYHTPGGRPIRMVHISLMCQLWWRSFASYSNAHPGVEPNLRNPKEEGSVSFTRASMGRQHLHQSGRPRRTSASGRAYGRHLCKVLRNDYMPG